MTNSKHPSCTSSLVPPWDPLFSSHFSVIFFFLPPGGQLTALPTTVSLSFPFLDSLAGLVPASWADSQSEHSSSPVRELSEAHLPPFPIWAVCPGYHWRLFPYLVFCIPDGSVCRAFLNSPKSMNGGNDSRLLILSHVSAGTGSWFKIQ